MAFLSKGKSIAVVEEVSYGASSPAFSNNDYIDYTAADISTDIAQIDREVTRQSLLKLESLQGNETSSGNITVEISAEDATNGVNGGLLYANGIGQVIDSVVSTDVASGGGISTSSIKVSNASGLEKAQVIKVNVTGGATGGEYTTIVSISGDTLTLSPDLSTTPSEDDVVTGLSTYILPKPASYVASLAVREHLAPTSGNTVDYDYTGVVVSEVDLNFPVGAIATAAFTIAGAGFTATTPGSTIATLCDTLTPVVGKNAKVRVMGVDYTAQDLSIKVSTDVTDVTSVTTDGITNKLGVAKTVTGTFKTEYTGLNNHTAFANGDKGGLSLLLKDGGASAPVIAGVIAPQIKFTKVARTEDSGITYDVVDFEVLSPNCDAVTEHGLSVFFRPNV